MHRIKRCLEKQHMNKNKNNSNIQICQPKNQLQNQSKTQKIYIFINFQEHITALIFSIFLKIFMEVYFYEKSL